MGLVVLDPTFEASASHTAAVNAPRLASLAGTRIALLDNSKAGGRDMLAEMEDALRADYGVAEVRHFRKPNLSAPAPQEMMDEVAGFDAVITAIGD